MKKILNIPELDLRIDQTLLNKELRLFRNNLRGWAKYEMTNQGVYLDRVKDPELFISGNLENKEIGFLVSPGITHHKDYTGYADSILVPLTMQNWCFKYQAPSGEEFEKTYGDYFHFASGKIHSLAPRRSMIKPFVALLVDFNK